MRSEPSWEIAGWSAIRPLAKERPVIPDVSPRLLTSKNVHLLLTEWVFEFIV